MEHVVSRLTLMEFKKEGEAVYRSTQNPLFSRVEQQELFEWLWYHSSTALWYHTPARPQSLASLGKEDSSYNEVPCMGRV